MLLSKLTPAETLMLKEGNMAAVKDLLKYTFMDLLLKQTLMIEEVQRQPSKRDPLMTYKYVAVGKNFNGYAALAHELPFLSTFQRNRDNRILFRNCVQIGYENARSQYKLHRTVITSPTLTAAFSVSWVEKILGGFSYTDEGHAYRRQVEDEISLLERELPKVMNTDKERALELLRQIGGNVFLLKTVDFAMLREIDQAFPNAMPADYRGCNSCGGCSTWTSHSNDFDTSCSADSSDSSGCSSGDSGCGGGCGGCGGGD